MPKKSTRSHIEERRTHLYLIGTESGHFDDFDKAVKVADALKNFLVRESKEKDYHCIGVIGVSRYCSKVGEVRANKFGKREFEPLIPEFVPLELCKRPPHIHILLVANPASTMKNLIYEYFKKNHSQFGKKVTWEKKVDTKFQYAVNYVLDQSEKLRTINLFSEELNPMCSEFINLVEARNAELGNKKKLFPKGR